jgi:vancomycin resistance protein YoaR
MSTTTKTKRPTAAAADAVRLVAEIASLQERRAEILAKLAAEVREMDRAITHATDALSFEVRNARIASADMATVVKDALAEKRVNTGQLSAKFCDAMESRGAAIYPMPYPPITNSWDVIPASNTI